MKNKVTSWIAILGFLFFVFGFWFFNIGVAWKLMWTGIWLLTLGFLLVDWLRKEDIKNEKK